MSKYLVIRTDTADSQISKIILNIEENFGSKVALEKLNELETSIMSLGNNPYMGINPRYMVLCRQKYKVLITEKNLVFYKINEEKRVVIVYAVVDKRQDYISILRGL